SRPAPPRIDRSRNAQRRYAELVRSPCVELLDAVLARRVEAREGRLGIAREQRELPARPEADEGGGRGLAAGAVLVDRGGGARDLTQDQSAPVGELIRERDREPGGAARQVRRAGARARLVALVAIDVVAHRVGRWQRADEALRRRHQEAVGLH